MSNNFHKTLLSHLINLVRMVQFMLKLHYLVQNRFCGTWNLLTHVLNKLGGCLNNAVARAGRTFEATAALGLPSSIPKLCQSVCKYCFLRNQIFLYFFFIYLLKTQGIPHLNLNSQCQPEVTYSRASKSTLSRPASDLFRGFVPS